jgi:hypothetical protein
VDERTSLFLTDPSVDGVFEWLIHERFKFRQLRRGMPVPVDKGHITPQHRHFVLTQKRKLGFALELPRFDGRVGA